LANPEIGEFVPEAELDPLDEPEDTWSLFLGTPLSNVKCGGILSVLL
jgi:hypothetical protein